MLARTKRLLIAAVTATAVCSAPLAVLAQTSSATPSAPATQPATPDNNPVLAERIAYGMAQGLLRARPIVETSWPATVALLEGAYRLAPKEPRIQRMLIEALLRENDGPRALEILSAYRQTEEGRNDEGAQVQTIDLYLNQIHSLDEKIDYLQDLVGRNSIAQSVRSYAAVRCAEFMAEHMQDTESMQMLDQALRLNPLNLRALRIKFQTQQNGTPMEKLSCMLDMLKSNPNQPALVLAVAQDLADAGMIQQALQWYTLALNLYPRTELRTPGRQAVADYAAEVFIGGDAKSADMIAGKIASLDPESLNAWLLKLIADKSMGDKDTLTVTSRQAQIALTNRLAELRRAAGDATATTRPVDPNGDVPVVDVAADLAKLQKANQPALLSQFATVAQTMSWIKIYFDDKPADADPWINAMAKVVPADDAGLARLQGWQLMKEGKTGAARAKLQPIADKDPFAAAALVLMAAHSPAAQATANTQARALLSANADGLTGAALTEMFASRGVHLVPGPVAEQLTLELAKFPRDWMSIIDQPQQFYSIRVEPVDAALKPGDPVLLRITLTNISDYDLTVGTDGIIHPGLWMDAQLRGADQRMLPSEAFDRITKRLVLPARQSMSQVVRLDTSELTGILLYSPQKYFQVGAMCMTNPITINGQITNGPAGYRVEMTRLIEREGEPYTSADVFQSVEKALQSGTAAEKVSALELMATYYNELSQVNNQQAKELATHFADRIRSATADADASVRGWALYVLSLLTTDKDLPVVLHAMMQDPGWEARLLAPVVVELKGAPKSLVKPLENDSDPLVKKLAVAVGQMPEVQVQPPTSQPVAAPAITEAPQTGAPVNVPSVGAPVDIPTAGQAPSINPFDTGAAPGISTTPPPAGGADISTTPAPAEGATISTTPPTATNPSH
jgi:tetratricopeptide (TPR) repeat protein